MKDIYFDNSATTKTDDDIAKIAYDVMTQTYGNPSSLHKKGFEAEKILKNAYQEVADTLGVNGENIYFTSGGTESNNLAIFGAVNARKRRGNKIVTTAFEHSSIKESMNRLKEQGFEVIEIIPNNEGNINPQEVIDAVDENTILVSAMLVNNEIGTIVPVGEIAKGIRRKNKDTIIHCDCVQGFGKLPIKIGKSFDVDLLSISGHKIYAPKGIGALYVKKGIKLIPIMVGGKQQNGIRSGTESVPLAVAMGKAAKNVFCNMKENTKRVSDIKNAIIESVKDNQNVLINSPKQSLPFILNISIKNIRSEIMLHFLESKGIYVSSGSACTKGASSHVLSAMGMDKQRADSAIRLSFGKNNSIDEVKLFIDALNEGIKTIAKR